MGRGKVSAGGKLMRYEVSHPEFGTAQVVSIGPDSATIAAADKWGVPDAWGEIAGYCTVRKLGPAGKPRCRRCGREFGAPGQASGICPDCLAMLEQYRREIAEIKVDRRARYDPGSN